MCERPGPIRSRRGPDADEAGVMTSRLDQVLDAAYETFTKHGVRRTTMEDIARTADMSRAAVHQYATRTTPSCGSPSACTARRWPRPDRPQSPRDPPATVSAGSSAPSSTTS
ncbi:helix-turn-helix domain-containing protein [Streptomyces sp. NPDC002889]|uniref:helix-turn-helix domain-containing protein n=1 Tax=Streptomyces sp. NPDC002889 TaxID=3364669 RepID=UPI003684C613